MRKTILLILFFAATISCSNDPVINNKNNPAFSLKEIFYCLLDTNAILGINGEELILFTQFKSNAEWNLNNDSFYVRHLRFTKNDSIEPNQLPDKFALDKFDSIYSTKLSGFQKFDTLQHYPYKYDSVFPVQLKKECDHCSQHIINSANLSTCVISDFWNSESDLFVFMEGKLDSIKINNAQSDLDFFQADITGDSIPEIFMINHFMMPMVTSPPIPMIELTIYKLTLKKEESVQ